MRLGRVASRIAAPAALAAAVAFAPAWASATPCSPTLVNAVELGDVGAIWAALDAGAPIRCTDEKGSSLLHVLVVQSVESDDDEGPEAGPISKLLIDRGADANALDATGKTPLMLACMLQKTPAVQGLLAAGADPNFAGPDSSSALEYAMRTGYVDLVTMLLQARANPNQRTSGDGLPLIDAVTMGSPTLVGLLLRAGADPNLVSAAGTTAMDHARQSGNAGMVALLEKPVAPGDRLKTEDPKVASAAADSAAAAADSAAPAGARGAGGAARTGTRQPGTTERLKNAIDARDYKSMEDLIAQGADVNATDLGLQPAFYAVMGGDLVAVDLLLKHGATLSASSPDGNTPLIYAIGQGNERLLQALISRKADLNFVSTQGATALMAACEAGNLKFAQILLDAGADPNVKGFQGMTALFWAAKDNHTDIVKELIKHKANVNVVDEQFGATPLVLAMSSGQIECVKALVDAGADATIVMKGQYAGMSALDVALRSGDKDLIKLLEKAKPKR